MDLEDIVVLNRYLDNCNCVPSDRTITIADGASLSVADYDALVSKNNTYIIEKQLPVDEWSLIGNISLSNNTYDILNTNAGIITGTAHDMAAAPFDYSANEWQCSSSQTFAYAADNTPTNFGAFMVWPFSTTIDGKTTLSDNYTIVFQSIAGSALNEKSSVCFNGITNNNTEKWFALSNPYIGRLSLSKFYEDNSSQLNSTYAYVWDNKTGDWEECTDIDQANKYALLPTTGFIVQADRADPTFTFSTSQITKSENIATTKSAVVNKIAFACESNGIVKEMYAHVDETSSNKFGKMDASVMFSAKENAVNPYMKVDKHNLLDNYFSQLPAIFDLNFNAYKDNAVKFSLTSAVDNIEVTLIDVEDNNSEIVLSVAQPININVTEGQNEGRYKLKFSKKNVSINDIQTTNGDIDISVYDDAINITGTDITYVQIYNALGQIVYTEKCKAGDNSRFKVSAKRFPQGIYVIKLCGNTFEKSQKVVIK